MTQRVPAPAGNARTGAFGHTFRTPSLHVQALTHRSYGSPHNERFEFIGDAVLNCVVAAVLFERHPDVSEGALTRMRAGLVNRDMLARIAMRAGLGQVVRLGEGEQKSGGASRPSILADALEAVFGAVFVDAGFDAARMAILEAFGDVLDDPAAAAGRKDAKTSLQEWLQARKLAIPDYRIVSVSGEAHAQAFVVECRIASMAVVAAGEGPTRRAAEQQAAGAALARVTSGSAADR